MELKKKRNVIKVMYIMAIIFMGVLSFGKVNKVSAATQAESVANYALSQVGTKERSAGSDNIIYNDWFYGKVVKNTYSGQYSWCHAFVGYCANQCGISTSVIPKTASCQSGVNFFKNKGRYYTRVSGYAPKVGDIIYLSTDGTATAHHVGIVYAVDDSYVYYVDGNNTTTSPHAVAKSKKLRSNSAILGYGNPAYTSSDSSATATALPNKKYNIENVKIASITSSQVTITWSTTNLPRCCMVVNAGGKTWKSSYAVGNATVGVNTFSATFDRSTISNCPNTVNILLYGYSTTSGAGANETVHRVTYGSPTTGELIFPSSEDKYWSDRVPYNMLSHGVFSGWVISDTAEISKVEVTVNGVTQPAQLILRTDVSKAYPNYRYVKGYSLTISPYYVKNGPNSYSVKAFLENGKTYIIKSGTFQAEKVDCIYDDAFFQMRYAGNASVKKLTTADAREKFFYDNLNNKIDGQYLTGSMVCDLNYYYIANADLKKQRWGGYEIYDHFIHYGLKASVGKEYRAVSRWVSLNYLHNTYSDLKNMSPEQLINWAATYGLCIDQRLLSNTNAAKAYKNFYRCTEYASLNKDLVLAYSTPKLTDNFEQSSCGKYYRHLWEYGVKERRKISKKFNVKVYCKNAGLSSSATAWEIFDHYCSTGYAKGIKTK